MSLLPVCYNEGMTLALLAEKLPQILVDFPNIHLVYLFGSQVTGKTGPMSDYDLAIFDAAREDSLDLQAAFQYAVVKLLNTERVDVVLLNRAPVELAYSIIADGKLLYQKDTYTRVEFEAGVMSKYGDYLPVLRFFQQQILQGDPHGKRVQRYRAALGRTRRTIGQAPAPSGTNEN